MLGEKESDLIRSDERGRPATITEREIKKEMGRAMRRTAEELRVDG